LIPTVLTLNTLLWYYNSCTNNTVRLKCYLLRICSWICNGRCRCCRYYTVCTSSEQSGSTSNLYCLLMNKANFEKPPKGEYFYESNRADTFIQ